MVSQILFSHKSDEHITPQGLYDELNAQYNFELDPATTEDNVLGTKYFYTKSNDGLNQSWENVNTFINPPYSETAKWVKKAHDQFVINSKSNSELAVVLLVASRTDTKWFHEIVLEAVFCRYCKIKFLKGRLKFRGQRDSAPFPSMVVTFKHIR